MKKYSLINNLLPESLTYQHSKLEDPYTIEYTPVDSFEQIYANHIKGSQNQLKSWSTTDPSFHRYWEDIYGDPHKHLYWTVDKFFRQNPRAAADVKERLNLSKVRTGKIKSAIPIFYDDNVGGEPWGYMYNGQVSPTGRIGRAQRFVEITSTGYDAEEEFAAFLKGKGYIDVKVVGGPRNPDVVGDTFQFEIGAGENKTLSLGAQFPKNKMSPKVAKRRAVLNNWFGTETLARMPEASPELILALWRSTDYDFLVKGRAGTFEAFALSMNPVSIGNILVQPLTQEHCISEKVRIYSGSHVISYESIDWSKATPLN